MSELRWYGWGTLDKTYALDHRPGAWNFLRAALDLRGDEAFPACDPDTIRLRAPRLSEAQLATLRQIVAEVKTDPRARMLHTYGKSYRDLIRLRVGEFPRPPDAVAFPANEAQVVRMLAYCAQNDFALIPFGGGSSVVGGVEPSDERITISLDLARMSKVLMLDDISYTAIIEAGILGPDLERELNLRGITLGHFPQSFEFSTLGGWIATRGAGLMSTGYGKIEEMTQSVRIATPRGIIETKPVPATAAGPALLQLIAGSEGAFGVITSATMRVRQLPRTKDYRAWLFKSFEDGVAAMRQMMQSDIVPATVRLSDEDETRSFFALRAKAQGWKNLVEQIGLQWINARGYSFDHGALMILGFEDWPPADRGSAICKAHGAFELGHSIANAWLRDRYETPYLRDVLIDHGVMVDTLETATTWANLPRLHKTLAEAIAHATQATGAHALVLTHVSHCYRDGASLYVTFLARMTRTAPERNLTAAILTQWQAIKRAATDCIMANGGTLSHHHGVGSEHAPWMNRENGAVGMQVLREFKHAIDPHNVMNPGKWLDVQRDPNDTAIDYNERFWNLPTR